MLGFADELDRTRAFLKPGGQGASMSHQQLKCPVVATFGMGTRGCEGKTGPGFREAGRAEV